MTEQTRRNVLRYGIAIDLVIMATGVGMLVPATATVLAVLFAATVALSIWKGGWKGGAAAFVLSFAALLGLFRNHIDGSQLATFVALSIAGGAIVLTATRPRTQAPALAAEGIAEPVPMAFASEPAAATPQQAGDFAQKPLERSTLAEVVPLHQKKQKTKKKKRGSAAPATDESDMDAARAAAEAAAERERQEAARRVAEEQAARVAAAEAAAERERVETARRAAEEEAERVASEAEAERIRVEQEATRQREQAARLAAEAEAERIRAEEEATRRREEAARLAAEAEAERIRAEEEATRQREEAARLAAQAAAERERAEVARRAAEAEAARLAAEAEAERIRAEEDATRQREEAARLAAEAEAERLRLEEEAARRREEAARLAAEAEAERERAEAARRAAEEEAARVAAEAEAARQRATEERARLARELDERLAREREEAQRALEARIVEERRLADETAARNRAEAERLAAEAEAERQRAEDDRRRAEQERLRAAEEVEAAFALEREARQRELQERLEAERRAAEEELRKQLESEREAMRVKLEQELAAEREKIAAERAASPAPAPTKITKVAAAPQKSSLIDTVTGWFKREPRPRTVNLKTKRVAANGNTTATRRPASPAPAPAVTPARRTNAHGAHGKPRLLMIERRRGTADTVAPKLRHRGVEVEVVERWVDAVDEIFRFRPNALCLDIEHPELDHIHRTLAEKASQLPIILTGRSASSAPALRHAAFAVRPYDVDDLTRLAMKAQANPDDLLAEQTMSRQAPAKPVAPIPVAQPHRPAAIAAAPRPVAVPKPAPQPAAITLADIHDAVDIPAPDGKTNANEDYEVTCFSCRAEFNAVDADWCSCLAKERTLVCTNCLSCFCKAPPAYKEKFWVEAPPRLFERKTSDARRQQSLLPPNPAREEVTRPLVLTVEDDEEIQAIVQRVCSNLGYGFIWATNGQDGLDLAHEYKPNLILSDAFMPKLDGREMCRMLKEDPAHADTRMIVMTGLYTDTKYRSEAVKRFHVDDYIAKPVAITDLINLLQKHLEGVTGLPAQEDLHELHRAPLEDEEELHAEEQAVEDDVPLADVLTMPAMKMPVTRPRSDAYEVCCFNCSNNFDAARAEWCSCVGRDNTLVCEHCGGCFCKAPAAYRERFWIDAPPSLFERKMIGSKRNVVTRMNPTPSEVKRPLILLVEDDENVQLIVRTVVSSMGYGFVVGANGQEGLSLAREYNPDLILSDAFMPKLDGREMCRLLKEDPSTSRSKAIIMTGLYTDRKYRNEALDYFKVDDYVAKPLAVDDLIKLFKKHLPQEAAMAH